MIHMVNFSLLRTNYSKRSVGLLTVLLYESCSLGDETSSNIIIVQESLTWDYDAKYWNQRYSLKDGVPSFLSNISGKILTTGKYLNVMRECGHNVQVFVYG